jgi:hypothetical protein
MKDEQAERLNKLCRACEWLSRKYNRPLPCIELSPLPLDFWEAVDGGELVVKGRFSVGDGKPTILLYDGDDVVQGLFHEFHHHYYDWVLGERLDSGTSTLEGHFSNLEEERKIDRRAWWDMLEFFGLRRVE